MKIALDPYMFRATPLAELPGLIKERSSAPAHQLQVVNEAGEVGRSIN